MQQAIANGDALKRATIISFFLACSHGHWQRTVSIFQQMGIASPAAEPGAGWATRRPPDTERQRARWSSH